MQLLVANVADDLAAPVAVAEDAVGLVDRPEAFKLFGMEFT
jgi:hypothetical protein